MEKMKCTKKSGATLRLKEKVKGTRFEDGNIETLFTIIRKRSKNNKDAENKCADVIDLALSEKGFKSLQNLIAFITKELKSKH
jgi:hypothetical protein